MCKVYNPVGSLTAIKLHLRGNGVHEFKSINELIRFQKNYTAERQLITSNHKLLIEQEKETLIDEIIILDNFVKTKRNEVEQMLLLELEKLKLELDNLTSARSGFVQAIVTYVKKKSLKEKISNNELNFNSAVADSLESLIDDHNKKDTRYQYINAYFDEAVVKSSSHQLQELERRKRIIDEVNNSIHGALGEQKVSKELEKLSDDYILINDFTYRFNPPIYNQQENDYIKSIQIDHILLSPSGIFLIETKNWSQQSLVNLSLYSPVQQIKRTNFALYRVLSEEISNGKLALKKHHWGDRKVPIRNLIVLINHKPVEEFQYVKILTLNDLLSYVQYFKPCFSIKENQTMAGYLLNLIRK